MSYTKYKYYKKQIKSGSTWVDAYPSEYMLSGNSYGNYQTFEECEESLYPTHEYKFSGDTCTIVCDGDNRLSMNDKCRNVRIGRVGACVVQFTPSTDQRLTLEKIYIDDSVETIVAPMGAGQNGFSGYGYLNEVRLSNSITRIGYNLFKDCVNLPSIEIPSGVTSIGNFAFEGCASLSSVTFNGTSQLTSIGIETFKGCERLNNFTIPNTVTSIGLGAFENCSSLTSISLPVSITTIPDGIFSGCTSLSSFTINSGVTSIGNTAFYGCRSLSSLNIHNNITTIGNSAFTYCSGATTLEIGSGVTSIGDYAFANCNSLSGITINNVNPPTLGASVFNNTNNCPIYVPCDSFYKYKHTAGWSDYADRISGITVCDIKKLSASYTGGTTFEIACGDSDTLTIDDVRSSASTSYYWRMSGAVVGDCVAIIGSKAFSACTMLKEVTLPAYVTVIQTSAFTNCSGLTSVTILAETPPTLAPSAFDNTNDTFGIYVPAESFDTYRNSYNWRNYKNRIRQITST